MKEIHSTFIRKIIVCFKNNNETINYNIFWGAEICSEAKSILRAETFSGAELHSGTESFLGTESFMRAEYLSGAESFFGALLEHHLFALAISDNTRQLNLYLPR